MRIILSKGNIDVINCHPMLRQSLLKFIAAKKRSIFTYHQPEPESQDNDAKIARCTYDPENKTIKAIKTVISGYKKLWIESDSYKSTGFTLSQLKDRGWTAGAIQTFLGDCDIKLKNPHYSSAAEMKIYHVTRVLKAESSQDWLDWYESTLERRMRQSAASRARISQSREEILTLFNEINIQLPTLSKKQLFDHAVRHYNDLNYDSEYPLTHTEDCDSDFLHRISTNYLRHRFNHYDERLERITGKVGCQDAYVTFKMRILDAISLDFPFLSDEVERQREKTLTIRYY